MTSLLLVSAMSFAQEIQKTNNKNGSFSLEKNGKVIVNENFEKAGNYDAYAGLIPAKLNGKWGFYDNDGKLIIPHIYNSLFASNSLDDWYFQSRILVTLNGEKKFIDKTGKETASLEFDAFDRIPGSDNYILFKNGKRALGDKDRNQLTDYVYLIIQLKSKDPVTFTAVRDDNKPYSLDANGQELGAAKTTSSSTSNSSSNNKAEKCTYQCRKCNKTSQGNCNSSATGITNENCFAQQPDPKGPRKNHEWRKQ